MPFLQAMAERANEVFNRENISKVDVSRLGTTSLAALASGLGIARSKTETDYLDTWPQALQAAVRAVLQSAVERRPPVPVTIAWVPGYDYEVDVWESKSVKNSIGAITILMRSPYPDVP
jgi:hypothetical protein